ncbi:short-chain dehydrogenase/reductase [Dactylonectria estremocensis]|uniref:Short-chain dehydrogenase/reductase n=1 Tax=Dactylonectria estremocensis TaxID=1079267 RepID=A0A9P9J5J3_9HYPO|nr:short-chain dehydrogenase/reductase [Dactylonectria estremocensis]
MFGGSKSVAFNPEKDIPSLTGKVILVTGGNAGLGKQAILEFSRHNPKQIWLASRNLEKAKSAADEIKQQVPGAPIELLELDLSSFDSVKTASRKVLSGSDRLDILMLNAGIMAVPPGLTKDGYEIQFGTNHMGHALLTKLLLPIMEKTAINDALADVRIISLTSYGHTYAPKGGCRFDTPKSTADGLGAYGRYYQSKLANVLWARQLAKAYPQFTVAAIHPGVVRTQLMEGATATPTIVKVMVKFGSMFLAPVEQGVKNQLWASVSKDVKSGEYYEPVGVGGLASYDGKNDELAKLLWDWTENELKVHCA